MAIRIGGAEGTGPGIERLMPEGGKWPAEENMGILQFRMAVSGLHLIPSEPGVRQSQCGLPNERLRWVAVVDKTGVSIARALLVADDPRSIEELSR